MGKQKNKFESLIYFVSRLNHHIQDEAFYNGRMLEGTLLLICSLPCKLERENIQ